MKKNSIHQATVTPFTNPILPFNKSFEGKLRNSNPQVKTLLQKLRRCFKTHTTYSSIVHAKLEAMALICSPISKPQVTMLIPRSFYIISLWLHNFHIQSRTLSCPFNRKNFLIISLPFTQPANHKLQR